MDNQTHEPGHDPLWDLPASQSGDADAPKPRFDGWTPFARALFLTVLADTGRVSLACEYAQRSRATAYTLRARDPAFAASWDAACELARAPLADALYERALDGTTETITRNGEVIAERHRHDNRLSMAVLHRLDKRCDRATEQGARHLAIVARWNNWLQLVGEGQEASAFQQLESVSEQSSQHCQHCQLPLRESPTEGEEHDPDAPEEIDCHDRCWQDDDGNWMTNFPPPPDFDGYRVGEWGDYRFERACTPEEIAVLGAWEASESGGELAHDAQLRDDWFNALRSELSPADGDQSEHSDTDCKAADPDP